MDYLNKKENWDTKTSENDYLYSYTYMCNQYKIEKYTTAGLQYKFKFDL
jgi:hypothetical protein